MTPIEWAALTLAVLYAAFVLLSLREVTTMPRDVYEDTETRRTIDYWWGER